MSGTSGWENFIIGAGMVILVSIVGAGCGQLTRDADRPEPIVQVQMVADTGCRVKAEDSSIAHCEFDPNGRYDFVGGYGWVRVAADYTYNNGNRPPSGQELIESEIGR